VRRFTARVCLAAGLGIYLPALPVFGEVRVLPLASAPHAPPAAGSPRAAAVIAAQSAAPSLPARDRSSPSESLLLIAGLTALGIITLWRS